MKNPFASGWVSALVLVVGCAANGASGKPTGQQPAATETVPVTVGTVVEKTVPVQVSAVGTVEPYSTVTVRPQVSGELVGVNFQQGQDVRKGELLFSIDSRPLEASLKQAEANLAKDTAQWQNADQQARRYGDLVKRGIATREQLDQVQANATALQASIRADNAAVENAKLQLAYSSIRSPVEGRTGTLLVHEGNVVTANQTALVVINQVRPVYVTFSVPEQYLSEVRRFTLGEKPAVQAKIPQDAGPPEQGTLTFVDNTVDPSTGTVRLRGTFSNPLRRLWPGQYVDVLLTLTAQPNAVVVASQAVQTGQAGTYVFVVKPDMTVESRPVAVQRTVGDDAIIARGLRAGERVVTDGQLRLVPGSRIEIKSAPGTVG